MTKQIIIKRIKEEIRIAKQNREYFKVDRLKNLLKRVKYNNAI